MSDTLGNSRDSDDEGEGPKMDPTFTNSRPKWEADGDCESCFKCKDKFSLFNRRHHCRRCGQVFCNKCSTNSVKIPQLNYNFVPVRVCDACFRLTNM